MYFCAATAAEPCNATYDLYEADANFVRHLCWHSGTP